MLCFVTFPVSCVITEDVFDDFDFSLPLSSSTKTIRRLLCSVLLSLHFLVCTDWWCYRRAECCSTGTELQNTSWLGCRAAASADSTTSSSWQRNKLYLQPSSSPPPPLHHLPLSACVDKLRRVNDIFSSPYLLSCLLSFIVTFSSASSASSLSHLIITSSPCLWTWCLTVAPDLHPCLPSFSSITLWPYGSDKGGGFKSAHTEPTTSRRLSCHSVFEDPFSLCLLFLYISLFCHYFCLSTAHLTQAGTDCTCCSTAIILGYSQKPQADAILVFEKQFKAGTASPEILVKEKSIKRVSKSFSAQWNV